MRKKFLFLLVAVLAAIAVAALLSACGATKGESELAEQEKVGAQQEVFQRTQPIPLFDWSLERFLAGKLYELRNEARTTYTVIVDLQGKPIFSCPSMGYGLPYNVSMSNPLQLIDQSGDQDVVVEQAEPNGLFTSPSTEATWVFCLSEDGDAMPLYSEPNVLTFPFPVQYDPATGTLVPMNTGSAVEIDIPDNR